MGIVQSQSSATCITSPCARGFGFCCSALSGADMYPASVAAIVMPPTRMVFADQAPNQRRVLEGTLLQAGSSDPVSRPLRQASPCPLSLRRPRDRRRLTSLRPETGKRHRGPSGPKRFAPSCSPRPPAPASAACVPACRLAMCPVWRWYGRAV